MAKRCVGIDIAPSYVCAVQIARTAEGFTIEKSFTTQARRSTDLLSDILKSLYSEHGFDRRAGVAVSAPRDRIFFKDLETDSAGLQLVMEDGAAIPQDSFPIASDQVVTQIYSHRQLQSGRYHVGATATSKSSLQERLSLLAQAKIYPRLIDAPIFAVHCAVAINHPDVATGNAIIAYVDDAHLSLAAIRNKDIVAVRNIPVVTLSDTAVDSTREQIAEVVAREARITWRKIFGEESGGQCRVYLVCAGDSSEYLGTLIIERLKCKTTIVDPYAKVQAPRQGKNDSLLCLAEGLALRLLAAEQTEGVNFLKAYKAETKTTLNLKKELAICAALTVAIVVFWMIGLFTQLRRLEANYATVKSQIGAVFQQTLPAEKNIVNPLVQLQQKLDSFGKDYQLFGSFSPDRPTPLDVLHSIGTNAPAQAQVKVDDLLIAADSARVIGKCDSFESVYQWQRLLQQTPGLTQVDVQDVQKDPKTAQVRFTMLLSRKGMEEK